MTDPIDVALGAVQMYQSGEMSFDDLTRVFVLGTLKVQGIEEPTEEQYAQRLAELNTASSFISAVRDDV